MKTLTLSESVFRSHLQPPFPKPSKLLNYSLFSLNTLFEKQNSKHSRRNSSLVLSRYSRQGPQNVNIEEEWLEQLLQKSSAKGHSLELRFLDGKSNKPSSRSMEIQYDCSALDESTAESIPRSKIYTSTPLKHEDVPVSDASFHSWLKFALLFGLLTFQGSQQAVAGSEFASGLQSIPYIGDLGDLSTGILADLFL